LDTTPLEVGETRVSPNARLINTASREVRVERIAPQRTLKGSRVEIWVPRPGLRRASDLTDLPPFPRGGVGPFPPRGATLADLRPAAGARVAGRSGSAFARLPLLITVTPTRRGCAGFGGLVIEYRSGFRRYRRIMKFAFGGHAGQRASPAIVVGGRIWSACNEVIHRLADRSG